MPLKSETDIFMSTLHFCPVPEHFKERECFLRALQVMRFRFVWWFLLGWFGVFLFFLHWGTHLLSKCAPCSWTNNFTDTSETACGRKARKETGPGRWGACIHFSAPRDALWMPIAYENISGTQFCHLTSSWAASLYILSLNNTTEHNTVWAWWWGSSFGSEQCGF